MALSWLLDNDGGDLDAVHCWDAVDWRSREEYGRKAWDWQAVMAVGKRLRRGGMVTVPCALYPFRFISFSRFFFFRGGIFSLFRRSTSFEVGWCLSGVTRVFKANKNRTVDTMNLD